MAFTAILSWSILLFWAPLKLKISHINVSIRALVNSSLYFDYTKAGASRCRMKEEQSTDSATGLALKIAIVNCFHLIVFALQVKVSGNLVNLFLYEIHKRALLLLYLLSLKNIPHLNT